MKLMKFFTLLNTLIPSSFGKKKTVEKKFKTFIKEELGFSLDCSSIKQLSLEVLTENNSKGLTVEKIGEIASNFLKIEFSSKVSIPYHLLYSENDTEVQKSFQPDYLLYKENNKTYTLITPNINELISFKYCNLSVTIHFILTTETEFKLLKKKIIAYRDFLKIDSHSKWRKAFLQCFLDAKELGAQEIYFGIPEADMYEFTVAGKKYSGKIDKEVRTNGISLLKNRTIQEQIKSISFDLDIQLSTSVFKSRDILVCSWGSLSCRIVKLAECSKNKEETLENEIIQANQKGLTKSSHILLIDDDLRFAEILKRGIAAKGFTVSVATSVNDALRYYLETTSDIDLVVTDYHMPKGKGSELLEMVRAKRGELPVIVLTSDDSIQTHLEMLTLGCDAVVNKGDDPRVLFAWIFRLLERQVNKKIMDAGGIRDAVI